MTTSSTNVSALQQTIISSLDGATSAGRRVYYGTRLQTSLLPAITFEIQSNEAAVIGKPALAIFVVTFNSIGDTASSALNLSEEIFDVIGAVAGLVSHETAKTTLAEPLVEGGDEAGLYIATTTLNFYE